MASILGPSEEKTNGTKLARLLIDGGTQALRNVLESLIHPPSTLQIIAPAGFLAPEGQKPEEAP